MSNKDVKLSIKDSLLIQILLLDPVINAQLIEKKDVEYYSNVIIDRTTGDLVFGRTKHVWLNHFIGDEKKISFLDFAMKTVAALSGQENNYDERILKALSQQVITEAVMKGNYTFVVSSLFDACRYGNKSTTRSLSQPLLHKENKLEKGEKEFRIMLNSDQSLGLFKIIFD